MYTFRKSILIILILSFFFLTGCSRTNVTGVWKNSEYNGQPLTSVLVVGLTGNPGNKFLWENKMATKLRQDGIKKVVTTLNAFPTYQDDVDKEKIIAYVNKNNIEGVLVTRLIDTKQETVYQLVASDAVGHRSGRRGRANFGRYYSHARNRMSSASVHMTTESIVLLETNLYQAKTQELLWSMSSDTVDLGSIVQLLESVSQKVSEVLKENHLI